MKASLLCVWVCGVSAALVLPGCKAQELRNDGVTQFQIGRIAEAKVLLKRSLDLDPGDPQALYYMARVMQAEGAYDQAIYYYQNCLSVQSDHKEARKWLARAMALSGTKPPTLPAERRPQPAERGGTEDK